MGTARSSKMAVKSAAQRGMRYFISKWAYEISYFPQLGLMRDDILYETPEVAEAIRRLPKDVYDKRIFRITRAINLSNKKIILPKEEWTQYENDVHYLEPYIERVKMEMKEKSEWDTK